MAGTRRADMRAALIVMSLRDIECAWVYGELNHDRHVGYQLIVASAESLRWLL